MRGLRRFFSRWQNILGLVLVLAFIFLATAAPIISPQEDPANPSPIKVVGRAVDRTPRPPSEKAPLGTLPGQQDVLHMLVWGTRQAILFGLEVTLITGSFGIILGALSASIGGWVNQLVMRVTDSFLAFPLIAGVVLFQQLLTIAAQISGIRFFGSAFQEITGEPILLYQILNLLDPLLIAFICFSWMPYARLMNTVVLRIKNEEYVQAARALGASQRSILIRHLIPNAISPSLVLGARDVGSMVLLQATFTYIGMGGSSVWGQLLVQGRNWVIGPGGSVLNYWWVYLPATFALVLFGIAWNLIGDGINDWLNPRAAW